MKRFLILLILILQSCTPWILLADSKPIIGVTPSFSNNSIQLNNDYINAINENGGIAIILPPTSDMAIIEKYVKMLDGAVFTGGPDIPPELYGQLRHHTTSVMEATRYEFESRFIKAFLDSGKPTLGICLGMQFSNVLMDGTLIQDLPELVGKRIRHSNGEMYSNFHAVGIVMGTKLRSILGTPLVKVISRHHQAVAQMSPIFQVAARSSDGVIEGMERTDGPFGIFVQWHPESMKKVDPGHRNKLFAALIRASENVRATRQKD